MKRFRYGWDPLCLAACLAYATNRWLFKPHFSSEFLHENFNDLLLIPAALPWLLWLERSIRIRQHDEVPSPLEIAGHWLVWSVVCEGIAPLLFAGSTADWRDVAAYAVGGIVAGLWWKYVSPRESLR